MIRLTVEQEALVSALKALSSDVNKSAPYILLSANALELTIQTQSGSTQVVRARIEEQGEKVIDYATFVQIVDLSYTTTLKITTDRYGVEKRQHVKSAINGLWLKDTGDFLELSGAGGQSHFKSFDQYRDSFAQLTNFMPLGTLEAAPFRAALKHALAYTAKSDNRPALQGIHLHVSEEKLTLAASDGYRLAFQTLDLTSVSDVGTVSITALITKSLLTLADTDAPYIGLGANETHVRFSAGDAQVTFARVMPQQGIFPDYRMVIPRKLTAQLAVQAQSKRHVQHLQKSVKRLAACPSVKLSYDNLGLYIAGKDATGNDVSAVLEGVWTSDSDPTIDLWVNPKSLSAALVDLPVGKTNIGFQASNEPLLMTRSDVSIVLMPMSEARR